MPPKAASVLNLETAWYNVKLPLRATKLSELANFSISKQELDALYREGQEAVDDQMKAALGGKNAWFMEQFQARGTTADRIAAAAVKLTAPDCVLHLDSFQLLFDIARADSHHFEAALKALAAVWPKVLPPRPLKRFAAQYFATLPEDAEKRKKVISYWYIEDVVKRTFAQFLAIAESSLKDNLLVRRQGWLDLCGKLLNSVAESRGVMIAMVVDKLGDPNKSVAHQAYHVLLDMLRESSTNQSLLMTELEKLAFQRNCPAAAQRYCVNVMNQLVFNKNERKLALKAVASYLNLFKQTVVAGTAEQSVTSAIITGLRRAFPFAGADLSSVQPHVDALFVLANTGPFLHRVSALAMIQQLLGRPGLTLDRRFYRALYTALLVSPHAMPSSAQLTVFFTTLYKALREDNDEDRVAAFVHRLLQRCTVNSDSFVCAALLLIAELVRAFPAVAALVREKRPEPSADPKEAYSAVAREPCFAHARAECAWVLNLLRRHAHPSVVKLAVLLLLGEDVTYDIHPLDDLTLANFLTMFADVNVDPAAAAATSSNKGVPVFRRQVRVAALPRVSDRSFVEAQPDQVDPAHLFVHRYAHQRERFLARRAQPLEEVWEEVAEQEAQELQPTEALFGPQMGVDDGKAMRRRAAAEEAAVEAAEDEDEFDSAAGDSDMDEAEDLDWGDDANDFDDDDEFDDFEDEEMADADDGDELAEALTAAGKMDTSKKARMNKAWLDQAEHGIARMKRSAPSGGRGRGAPQRKPQQPRPRRR